MVEGEALMLREQHTQLTRTGSPWQRNHLSKPLILQTRNWDKSCCFLKFLLFPVPILLFRLRPHQEHPCAHQLAALGSPEHRTA